MDSRASQAAVDESYIKNDRIVRTFRLEEGRPGMRAVLMKRTRAGGWDWLSSAHFNIGVDLVVGGWFFCCAWRYLLRGIIDGCLCCRPQPHVRLPLLHGSVRDVQARD